MAVNLVGVVMQYLTPNRIGRIAGAFNLDSKSAQSVAEVSVPSLLAGLASIALYSRTLNDTATQSIHNKMPDESRRQSAVPSLRQQCPTVWQGPDNPWRR